MPKNLKTEEHSSDKDLEHLINTVNELTIRLDRVEELIKDLSSGAHNSDVSLSSGSTDHTERSDENAPTVVKSYPYGESLSFGQGNFPQSYLRDMMTSLSMPGLQFIGGTGRPWFHSCLWIFIHIVSLLISYVFIKEEYDNWKSSPVVKTISNNLTYVNEIPFPAITVCLPGSVSDGNDYAGMIKKCISCNHNGDCTLEEVCSYEEIASLAVASLVCPFDRFNMTSPEGLFVRYVNESVGGTEFSMYLKNVFPHTNVEIEQFRSNNGFIMYGERCFGNQYLNFVSSFGMCFTMNGLKEKDIFKENTAISYEKIPEHDNSSDYVGKDFTLEKMTYLHGDFFTIPAYISENHQISFSILGRYSKESVALCGVEGVGPNVFFAIHNPVDVPFLFNSRFDLKFGEAKEIRVIPEMIITEKILESYTPLERGCFYSHERELYMFKRYSEQNCKAECSANCSLQQCGCVPYFLPRHNSSVRVCIEDCVRSAECDRKACSCLPDCYALSYDLEIVNVADNAGQKGSVEMNYKINGFYATVRVSLTNLAQFMAYSLGIFGVFNGFSFMMIYEIFYFLTFRLWNSLKSSFN